MAYNHGRYKENKKSGGSLIIPVILLVITAGLYTAARRIAGFAEWYASNVYPHLVESIGRFSGMTQYSAAEFICLLIPVLLIADIIICRHQLRKVIKHILVLVCVLALMYTANCGVNYYRNGFVSPDTYVKAEFTEADLVDYCNYVIVKLRESDAASADEAVYPSGKDLSEGAIAAMTKLGAEYPGLAGYYPQPKQLRYLSGFFSSMGVSGIYSPFTIEANVNGQMEGMEMPFTSCHELSHLRGYMNEGEANYIGWLACIGSDDPAFRRSGWLIAWSYAGSSLRRTDPDKFEEVAADLPESAAAEIRANHEFWASHETKASEIQDQVNDAYLKSNGLKDGVASYGKLTTLMLLWYQDNH